MSTIPPSEVEKRMASLRKQAKKRSMWYGASLTDQQMLRRKEQALYNLILFCVIWLIQWGVKAWFDSPEWLSWGKVISSVTLCWLCWLWFSLLQTRQLLELFEMQSPQNFADLEHLLRTQDTVQDIAPNDRSTPQLQPQPQPNYRSSVDLDVRQQ